MWEKGKPANKYSKIKKKNIRCCSKIKGPVYKDIQDYP